MKWCRVLLANDTTTGNILPVTADRVLSPLPHCEARAMEATTKACLVDGARVDGDTKLWGDG
jgi:hypothetical protein